MRRLSQQTRALAALSLLLALSYGLIGPGMHDAGMAPALVAALKSSGIALLAVIALINRSRALALALAFGATGDALLALGDETFVAGAAAFLVGHLFYIALFIRNGIGVRAALTQPRRLLPGLALALAAALMTPLLAPPDHALFPALVVYTVVLTLMALSTFTLASTRWLVMAGGVLFVVSDGFVAANMFHPQSDPALQFASNLVGWMVYWAAQAGLCVGALGMKLDGAP